MDDKHVQLAEDALALDEAHQFRPPRACAVGDLEGHPPALAGGTDGVEPVVVAVVENVARRLVLEMADFVAELEDG